MNTTSVLVLSAALAMDATAVAAARGGAAASLRRRDVVRVAAFFGGFQALMPLVGWGLGDAIGPLVAAWEHWLAFVLLGAIGVKMLWEARSVDDECALPSRNEELFGTRVMLVLAVATSIDALAAGVTLPLLGAPMLLSLASIGLVTAALSAVGTVAGRRFGNVLGRRMDAFGGVVLIGLGVKSVAVHLGLF